MNPQRKMAIVLVCATGLVLMGSYPASSFPIQETKTDKTQQPATPAKFKPEEAVQAAKSLMVKLSQAKTMPQRLDCYSNELGLMYGALMLTPLVLASKGISGVSTADVSKPDTRIEKELTDLLKQYNLSQFLGKTNTSRKPGVPDPAKRNRSQERDEFVKALERNLPNGRKFALDVYQLSERVRQRNKAKGGDPFSKMFKQSPIDPNACDYAQIAPTVVSVTLKKDTPKASPFEIRFEDGAWRLQGDGMTTIRTLYGERKK